MQAHQTNFSSGSVYRNILEVAVPMTIAQCLNLLYNVVDRMYIGRIEGIGSMALTGVGLCFPIITLVTAFTNLFGSGGGPLFAMERGKGNTEEAEKIMGNAFTMLVITGVILTVAGSLFYEPILYLFGASDATFPFARDYIQIYILGSVFVMVSVGMNPFINGQGFGNTGMLTILIGAVLNIILDPIFIFVFGMGVRGAALATILSQFFSAVWVMRFLTGKKAEQHLRKNCLRVQWRRLKSIMALGVSSFVMAFNNGLVQIACNVTLQTYGGDIYIGIMTVLNSVREIFTMPVSGLTNGASPVMSYNYGRKSFDRVKKAIVFVTVVCVAYTMAAWGVLRLWPEAFIRLFDGSGDLMQAGVPALHIYFFGFCFMALQFTGQCVFVALGKAGKATFFSIFRKVVMVVPLTLLLPMIPGMGVDGVFWAEPISNVIGGCVCFITMLLTILPELKKQT